MTLFDACINSTTLNSAVLIKRRGGGGKELRTYLRIEFTDLLITDFNWDEDDVIKEKIKFVCRKAHVQYSIENNDGTLKPAGQPRKWSVQNLPITAFVIIVGTIAGPPQRCQWQSPDPPAARKAGPQRNLIPPTSAPAKPSSALLSTPIHETGRHFAFQHSKPRIV